MFCHHFRTKIIDFSVIDFKYFFASYIVELCLGVKVGTRGGGVGDVEDLDLKTKVITWVEKVLKHVPPPS